MPPVENQIDQDRTRREILGQSDRIPPLPDVVVRVIGLLNAPETQPEDLSKHLANDHVLVAKMLAMVNSPYFGLNREIKTIKDAVMVLGFRGLRTLTVAASTAKYLDRDYSCYGHTDKGLWQHSLAVAAGAGELAKLTGHEAELRDELFVAGLLHDIGKMLLSSYLLERKMTLVRSGNEGVHLERDAIGMDHTEAGALVCAKWNLSELVQETLRHHHSDHSPEALRVPCAIIRLADALAHERGTGYQPDHAPRVQFRSEDLDVLDLKPTWDKARESVHTAMDAALAALDNLLV